MGFWWDVKKHPKDYARISAKMLARSARKPVEMAKDICDICLLSDSNGDAHELIGLMTLAINMTGKAVIPQCDLVLRARALTLEGFYEQAAAATDLDWRMQRAVEDTKQWAVKVVEDPETGLAKYAYEDDPDAKVEIERSMSNPLHQKFHAVELRIYARIFQEVATHIRKRKV